jgi:hypothetical protein
VISPRTADAVFFDVIEFHARRKRQQGSFSKGFGFVHCPSQAENSATMSVIKTLAAAFLSICQIQTLDRFVRH